MFGLWRSRWHYADPAEPKPDLTADTEQTLWKARFQIPTAGRAHPVVAVMTESGRWQYLGWWKSGDSWSALDKRVDPHIYDGVRYGGKTWSGGPPPQPHVHPTSTQHIS